MNDAELLLLQNMVTNDDHSQLTATHVKKFIQHSSGNLHVPDSQNESQWHTTELLHLAQIS
jgi:hypothetical protein